MVYRFKSWQVLKKTRQADGEGIGNPCQYSCLGNPVGCHLWGRKELDTTERLHFHFSLSCTGEGNGNPFQCSCLENPRDGGAWWAAIYGAAQSRPLLKWLRSSSRWAESKMYVEMTIAKTNQDNLKWRITKLENLHY